MTDPSFPEATEKTTAELESEASKRARLAMASPESEQKTPPGQPEVTRFRKTSGRRTLMVSLVSLALLIALALGGDRLLGVLKKGDEKEADAARRGTTCTNQPRHGQQSVRSVRTEQAGKDGGQGPGTNRRAIFTTGITHVEQSNSAG